MDQNLTEAMFIAQQQSIIVHNIAVAIVFIAFFWMLTK